MHTVRSLWNPSQNIKDQYQSIYLRNINDTVFLTFNTKTYAEKKKGSKQFGRKGFRRGIMQCRCMQNLMF